MPLIQRIDIGGEVEEKSIPISFSKKVTELFGLSSLFYPQV